MHYIIRNKTIINSEAALEAQLNTLEKIGAVLPCNRMSIHYLLNPDGENNLAIQMQSNKEIFAAVQHEHDINDSEGTIPQSPEPQIPRPSKREMCSLISQALRYLEDDVDAESNKLSDLLEDYQQKLMTELHFNGQQTRITDYFQPATIKSAPKLPVPSTSAMTL